MTDLPTIAAIIRRHGGGVVASDQAAREILAMFGGRPVESCYTHRHKKRGTLYAEVARGELQACGPVSEGARLVAYRGQDGRVWFRPETEFEDGRFEPAPPETTR